MISRKEHGVLRIYTHFGTGNYHTHTARLYTDLSLFTSNQSLGRDAVRLFNYTTGYIEPNDMEQLIIAPLHLKDTLIGNIDAKTTLMP